ncbi:MAG: hypothetical protein HOV92_25075, partial [Streptomyces sp.]|nr:hypothetical protein [Streptomyces sp.]
WGAELDAAIRTRPDGVARRIATALLHHASVNGRLEGGTAKYRSMSVYYPVAGRQVPVWTLSLQEGPVRDELSFAFGSITHHLGREKAAAFASALPAVPELQKKLEVLPAKGYNAWPSVTLPSLASEPEALEGILSAIQGLIDGQEASG